MGTFIITIQEETSRLIIHNISDVGFGLFEQLPKSDSDIFFYRAGVKARPKPPCWGMANARWQWQGTCFRS